MELEAVLQELTTLTPGKFPRAALEAAIAQQEAITPRLLQALEDAPRLLERLESDENYMLPLYAFYLLAQFRETRAYPLIVDFFSLPGETPLNVTGDFVTESLGRVLAAVSGSDMTPMKRLAENPQVNEYTRDAALHGLVCLVANDLQSRETVMTYFQSLLQSGLEREYSFVLDGLLSSCADLYPEEVFEEFRRADDENLFEDMSWVEERMALGKDATLAALRQDRHCQLITNTVAELEWWACFQPRQRPIVVSRPALPASGKKVGRNAPCPCGSGKKTKHCCGKPG